ncbi:MAG: beta-N-acetylhexosaminidase [Clostridia bacterium]|nr:beta-N-acetylhexosaminidase [Clostridia bacterium]
MQRIVVGHHLMVGFFGTQVTDELRAFVRQYKFSNFILFRRNVESREQLADLCRQLQQLSIEETGLPAIIATDQEGGVVSRLPQECANVPTAMAVAATGDPRWAYRAGEITGREMMALGVNCDLAPSVDVNCNPRNPVINVRSYGDTPQQVSEFACGMIRGLQDQGVMACAKHFPGHGDTDTDSHVGLPCVDKTMEELESCELAPFRAAIDTGVDAVMTTHILFPKLDDSGVPATMSPAILTSLLRRQMGFGGMIITDCMMMDAIAKHYGTVEGSVAACAAGADIVCICHDLALAGRACEAIEQAMEEGRIDRVQMEASAARIAAQKAKLAAAGKPDAACVGSQEHLADVAAMREAAVCHVGASVPQLGSAPLFVACSPYTISQASDAVNEKESFAAWMQEEMGGEAITVSRTPDACEIARACDAAQKATSIVLGTCNAHLMDQQLALMRALAALGKPMVVVALRNSYDLAYLPQDTCGFAVYEYIRESAVNIARVLRGELNAQGRLATRLEA